MEFALLLRGLVIGVSIAAPVGPIGVLCIRRTLAEGRAIGFASGMGAATADTIYGCIAALGLSVVTTLLIDQLFWVRLLGGLFLCYLGFTTLRAAPAEHAAAGAGGGLLRAYGSTLLLTLTNPATILSFTAILASLGMGSSTGGYSGAALLVGGVLLGSTLWWLILSSGVSLLRSRVTPPLLRGINLLSGGVIIIFGVLSLASLGLG